MSSAVVFDVEKFATKDGPGIRTTVFLKGCPLRCKWCHNPESWHGNPEILFSEDKCTRCGTCVKVCPKAAHIVSAEEHRFDRAKCIACGACAKVCPADALELCGSMRTVDDVLADVMKDKLFYDNSNGGMTLSGGEPLIHGDFAIELLRKAKESGLHTAVETCGFVPQTTIEAVLPYVDLWLFDIKTLNADKHKEFAGQSNDTIQDNLAFINASNVTCSIILRCPIIPGLNDSGVELQAIGRLADSLSRVTEINVEPYHPLGVGKGKRLGISVHEAPFPENDYIADVIAKISSSTSKPVIKA